MHLHRPAEHETRRVRQGVLELASSATTNRFCSYLAFDHGRHQQSRRGPAPHRRSSRHEAALAWARDEVEQHIGPLALVSDAFDFTETDYYAATMGDGLKKQFVACAAPIDPGELAAHQASRRTPGKPSTRRWAGIPEPRPLNLDPGYVTPAKLVLASTKDHAHRIYLAGRHLRRGDARLSPAAVAAARLDVSRLPPGRLPSFLHRVPRLPARSARCWHYDDSSTRGHVELRHQLGQGRMTVSCDS